MAAPRRDAGLVHDRQSARPGWLQAGSAHDDIEASARSTPERGSGSEARGCGGAGALVAVAVLDVLPRCLSSKYAFWDPDLAGLSLGTLTALREIAWVADASRACPQLRYYYQARGRPAGALLFVLAVSSTT